MCVITVELNFITQMEQAGKEEFVMSRTRKHMPKTTMQMAEVSRRKSGPHGKLRVRKKEKTAWKREWEKEMEEK